VPDESARQAVVERAKEAFRLRQVKPSHLRRFMRNLHGFVLLLAIFTVVTLGTRQLFDWALLVLAAAALSAMVIWWLRYRERRPFLLDALREFGDERCIACQHPLRGLPRDVIYCPECGAVRVFVVPDEELPAVKLQERGS